MATKRKTKPRTDAAMFKIWADEIHDALKFATNSIDAMSVCGSKKDAEYRYDALCGIELARSLIKKISGE